MPRGKREDSGHSSFVCLSAGWFNKKTEGEKKKTRLTKLKACTLSSGCGQIIIQIIHEKLNKK